MMKEFADSKHYHWWLGLAAFMDSFMLVIPTDGLLVSSLLLSRSQLFLKVLFLTVGSTLGSVALAAVIQFWGIGLIAQLFPKFIASQNWHDALAWVAHWGDVAVFVTGLSPVPQHPTLLAAAVAMIPLLTIGGLFFLGRLLKYVVIAVIAVRAPHLIGKIWGLRKEIKEAEKL